MAYPDGLWFSYVRSAPSPFPNDGVVIINPLSGDDFTGSHYRPPFEKTTLIEGHFTQAATTGAADHIMFTETYNGVTYEYESDIFQLSPDYYVTINGKRRVVGPVNATSDDWVGTHTT